MIEDPMSFGIQITIIGLIVVFISLALIAVIIGVVLGRVDEWFVQLKRSQSKAKEAEAPLVELPADQLSPELLAVISAAVTVAIDKKIRIKMIRYRRVPAQPTWSVQGRATIMASHTPKR